MSKIKPITPNEIIEKRQSVIPDEVFEAFNELITQNFNGSSATVMQHDVNARLKKKGVNIDKAYKNNWLDIEDIYREAGWEVTYDKPGYNETYDASFEFRKKGEVKCL